MRSFDVCGPLPEGTTLLEASAGTGKTFTLAALTARYVAEGVAELSQMMLVTFGNAASRELRERVRERLVTAERALRDPAAARSGADEVVRLLAAVPDAELEVRRERLVRALAGFDQATIATTHSFCASVLAGLGTAADRDPAAVFTESVDDLVREVVDDLYLRSWARPGADEPPLTHAQVLELGRRAVGSDRQARLEPVGASGLPAQRRAVAAAVRDEVARRKQLLGLVDHDDALVQLRDALAHPVHGPVACARVRARYAVVLVDEFQDTDPVQWDVLRLAFAPAAAASATAASAAAASAAAASATAASAAAAAAGPAAAATAAPAAVAAAAPAGAGAAGTRALVLIGDPKQAIYAFRGGDVTTYLTAAAQATALPPLTRNWRSDAPLLTALGHLLGGAALGDPRIAVGPVEAAHPVPRLTGAGAPLRLRRLPRTGLGPTYKGLPRVAAARDAVAADVAADVVRLLSGPARLSGRPVEPRDVAVLVRTHRQGLAVREALARAGVPAVLAGGGSVFGTDGARDWLVLLEALEQPHRAGRVRAAALTVFLGETEASLDAAGDELPDRLAPRLRRWADLLADRGVAAVTEALWAAEQLPARVLARPGGERLLTDLRHVGQALHAAAVQDGLGLTALVAWLRRRLAQAAEEAREERSRRLESDAAAVQVMTVHVSKGLEFPVVHVPYGWDRWSPRPDVLRLHDDDGARVLDVGGPGSPGHAGARARHEAEESGEDLRLLYVALTRACCQVVAHWAPSGNTASAPLHRLLFGAAGPGAEPAAQVPPPPDEQVAARLDALVAAAGGTVSAELVVPAPPVTWSPQRPPAPSLAVSRLTRGLDPTWRRTSYSALTAAAHEAPLAEHDTEVKDDEGEPVEEVAVLPPVAPPGEPTPLSAFPGGTAFGTLVHEVLEDLDPDALPARCAEAVARRAGSGVDPAALAAGLLPVLRTPLADLGLALADVAPGDRLAELAFELPLAGGDTDPGRAAATLRDVADLLAAHDLGPLAAYPGLLRGLEPTALRGFLTGSIDALLRLPDGRFSVADHKTNRLGTGPVTAWHYRPEALVAEMLRSHYVLQALLYAVATHRFLRGRLRGYDPERSLGPVLYLFVRGMAGPSTPPGCGVFAWQPPPGLVPALSDLLAGAP